MAAKTKKQLKAEERIDIHRRLKAAYTDGEFEFVPRKYLDKYRDNILEIYVQFQPSPTENSFVSGIYKESRVARFEELLENRRELLHEDIPIPDLAMRRVPIERPDQDEYKK